MNYIPSYLDKNFFEIEEYSKIKKDKIREVNRKGLATAFSLLKEDGRKFHSKINLKRTTGNDKHIALLSEGYYLLSLAIEKELKLSLYECQKKGALALHGNGILEMKTGEGKTLTGISAACLNSIFQEQTIIITPNDYLAERDYSEAKKVADALGVSIAYIYKGLSLEEVKKCYTKEIVYVSNERFIDNFIDSLSAPSLDRILIKGFTWDNDKEGYFDKKRSLILDEIDSILIDDATSFYAKSETKTVNKKVYRKAYKLSKLLTEGMYGKTEAGEYYLTTEGDTFIVKQLEILENEYYSPEYRELRNLILKGLQAINDYKDKVDYIVDNEKVILINKNSGRLKPNSKFLDGIHQLIEIKEGLTPSNSILATHGLTYPSFYSKFKNLSGMSGTVFEEEDFFNKNYTPLLFKIKERIPCIRIDNEDVFCKNDTDKNIKIVNMVVEKNKKGQPILIVVANSKQANILCQLLEDKKLSTQVLTAENHKEEANLLSHAGDKGSILISTIMAGRGVDIKTTPEVNNLGGLCVIAYEHFYSQRIDAQVRGRTGRRGANGETYFFPSLGDEMSAKYVSQINSLSEAELKIKKIMKLENEEESMGAKKMKAIYYNAQKEGEHIRALLRDSKANNYRLLSDEYIQLFTQKNNILESTDEVLLRILSDISISNNLILTEKYKERILQEDSFRTDIATIIWKEWKRFFNQDRIQQRILLFTEATSFDNKNKYIIGNLKRYDDLLKTISKQILSKIEEINA